MALEQIADSVPKEVQESGMYNTLDVYTSGLTHMYTGPMDPFDPIGSRGSGFQLGGPGNIFKRDDFGLQERYDFSGHGGSEPHLNYDLSGSSKKFSGSALGDNHFIKLFSDEDD